MMTLAKKRRARFAGLALVALTLGTILMSTPTASAQFRRGGGFYGRGYGGGFGYGNRGIYNRGYGGYGYGGGLYNRGYGGYGYGSGLYNRGYYGGNIVTPYASPIAVPGINIGIGSGYYGGLGGYY